MTIQNADIARLFNEMADLLEIGNANPFRVRAYRRAAATLEDMPESAAKMLKQGADLSKLPGIGKDLAGKIEEIVRSGHFAALDDVEARTPPTLTQLLTLPGMGPKRARLLYDMLNIATLDDLAKAAAEGKIRELRGFSETAEAKLLEAIRKVQTSGQRFGIATAERIAAAVETHLRAGPGVGRVMTAGSLRRRRDTVGDLDILVTAADGAAVADHVVRYDQVADILSKGPTRSTVRLKSGMQVDVRVVPEESYGAAMHYFTGSKAHNIAIRRLALIRGLKLNEYGIFRDDERIGGHTEEAVFAAVDLPWIPPELREDRGEIAAAREGRLPRLVTIEDIRGDLHAHTAATDGGAGLEAMAEAAMGLGYEYLAVTDHFRSPAVPQGLDANGLAAQLDAIDRLNDSFENFRVLKSCEVDILEDGALALPDGLLERLDFTVCAVHSGLDLDERTQTERIVRAMDNRHFNILAHPAGRLIGEREPMALDFEKVMAAALERGCFLEVNADPRRIDLDDGRCRAAKEVGLKLAVSSDARSARSLGGIRFGVDQARRGWLEPGDVLNTRPWPDLKKLFVR